MFHTLAGCHICIQRTVLSISFALLPTLRAVKFMLSNIRLQLHSVVCSGRTRSDTDTFVSSIWNFRVCTFGLGGFPGRAIVVPCYCCSDVRAKKCLRRISENGKRGNKKTENQSQKKCPKQKRKKFRIVIAGIEIVKKVHADMCWPIKSIQLIYVQFEVMLYLY